MAGSLYLNNVSAQAFVPLPLQNFLAIASNDIPAIAGTPAAGKLAADTAPKLKRVSTSTDKAIKLEWAASGVIEITYQWFYPPDMDATAAFTVHLQVKMGGSTDTPVTAIGVFEGIGDTNRGGNTAAASNALSDVSVSVTPTAGHPNFCSISITPGAHTTDVFQIYEAYILYKKKLLST